MLVNVSGARTTADDFPPYSRATYLGVCVPRGRRRINYTVVVVVVVGGDVSDGVRAGKFCFVDGLRTPGADERARTVHAKTSIGYTSSARVQLTINAKSGN